ncbi:MAG: hypothetical protein ABIO70_09770 [Pseudomonadota bacterium]
MPTPPIDRDKLRVFVRKLGSDEQFDLLDRAIDLLPASKLASFVQGYARPAELRADGPAAVAVLAAVQAFHGASLRGDYYQDFRVNSRNFTRLSEGTRTWIAECERLMGLCVGAARGEEHAAVREAFELLFDLLCELDEGSDAIVFFADEGGSWQVDVRWESVLPAWFRCLAATAAPEEYATLAHGMIEFFAHHQAQELLPRALSVADTAQRAALAQLPPPRQSPRRPIFAVADRQRARMRT